MFPEIVIGPILIVSGVLIILYREILLSVMHKGLERLYGAAADALASGRRASVGMMGGGAGAGWIVLGVIAVIDALAF